MLYHITIHKRSLTLILLRENYSLSEVTYLKEEFASRRFEFFFST